MEDHRRAFQWSCGRKFLKSSFAERTAEENYGWKLYLSLNLPSYLSLSVDEFRYLLEHYGAYLGPMDSLVCGFLVLIGLGIM